MRARPDQVAMPRRPSARYRMAAWCGVVTIVLLVSFLVFRPAKDSPPAPTNAAGGPARIDGRTAPPLGATADPRPATVPEPPTASSGKASPRPDPAPATERWRALTQFDFAALPIGDLPPDDGNVAPIAAEGEIPTGGTVDDLKRVEQALPAWAPGHVSDRVQRVRNYLLILAVADFAQSPLERFLPGAVLAHMLKEFPRDELAQLVCWVALHSDDGDVAALADPLLVGLGASTLDPDEVRTRTYYYGVKLTRRIVGY